MVQLTIEQRVFVVSTYQETKSYQTVQQRFRQRFPDRNPPTKRSIYQNVLKYTRHGTSLNRNKGHSGRRRTARSEENVASVRDVLRERPREVSARRNFLGLSASTFNRITRNDLRWHPYKIKVVQKLKPQDFPRRIAFCNWFTVRCHNVRFLPNIIIGDEACFSMNGKVCTQNVRCYAPQGQSPDYIYERSDQRHKLHVWIGLCGNGEMIGPYFFNRNVNGATYLEMLETFVFPAVSRVYQRYGPIFHDIWWMQDGAPCHRSRIVTRALQGRFENRFVSLNQDIEWPPRSPDLTPCDFFLWGYLKQKVFRTPPENVVTLRRRIVDASNELREQRNFIRDSFNAMERKAHVCIAKNGRHVN